MRIRTTRRAIYAATALTVLTFVGGFAMATIPLGGANTSFQGSQTTTVSNVVGLSYTSTILTNLGGTGVTNTTCSSGTPCSVTSTGATDCAGGVAGHTLCAAGDFVEQVTLTTTASTAFSGTLKITLYVSTGAGTDTGITYYYTQTSTSNTAQTIVQDFDTGSSSTGPAGVTAVSAVITT